MHGHTGGRARDGKAVQSCRDGLRLVGEGDRPGCGGPHDQQDVREAEEYSPDTRNRLVLRIMEQRMDEVRAANIMLEEESKDNRLELKKLRQLAWRNK